MRRERGKGYWGREREGRKGRGEGGKGEGGGKERGGGVCVIGIRGIDAPGWACENKSFEVAFEAI